jgi:molybdate transport system permease protein
LVAVDEGRLDQMIGERGDWRLAFLLVEAFDPGAVVAHDIEALAPGNRMRPDDRMGDRRKPVDFRLGRRKSPLAAGEIEHRAPPSRNRRIVSGRASHAAAALATSRGLDEALGWVDYLRAELHFRFGDWDDFYPLYGYPILAICFALLVLFGHNGPIGSRLEPLGIVFAFRWTGAALACAIMGFPLMVRAIQLSAEAVDRRLEQAAGTLGANPAYVFLTVTLPLMAPGIIAGAILSFARAMGEFGATITFVSNIPGETQTLPTLIYTFTQVPGGEAGALRLTLISLGISLSAILVSEWIAQAVSRRVRG